MIHLLLSLLLGCADEAAAPPDAAPLDAAAPGAASPDAAPPAEGGAASAPTTPPVPGAPTTASPENPNGASGVAGPPAGRPPPTGFKLVPGETVKVKGSVSWSGRANGTLRLDVLHNGTVGSPPELMHALTLSAAGPFEVEVPKGTGELALVAYVDANDNGPEPTEPTAGNRFVTVADADISGVDLVINAAGEQSKTLADGTVVTAGTDPNATAPPK